jgi:hypothetical protein
MVYCCVQQVLKVVQMKVTVDTSALGDFAALFALIDSVEGTPGRPLRFLRFALEGGGTRPKP